MQRNRSVPVDTILPHVNYKNLPEAIAWLGKTLGFVEHYRYGDPLSGAQVHVGGAFVMLKQARGDYRNPTELGFGTQSLTIFVEDIELQYAVVDLEGHHWLFSRHAHDLSPDAWGATITNPIV
jgi:uncharacterized glyoxalase superfamily protein PhnB